MIGSAASRRTGVAMIVLGVAWTMGCSTHGDAPPPSETEIGGREPQPSEPPSEPSPEGRDARPQQGGAGGISSPPLAIAAVSSTDVGGMTGSSSFEPVAIIRDADPLAVLLIGNDDARGRTSIRRCKHDGSTCAETTLFVERIAAATYYAPAKKVLVVTDKGALQACSVTGVGCAPATVPGTKPWGFSHVILDPLTQKIVRRGCEHIERCNADGSGCVAIIPEIGSATSGSCVPFDLTFDEGSQKLVAVGTTPATSGPRLSIGRCNVDGTSCEQTVLDDGSASLGDSSLLGIDRQNGKLVVVASPHVTYPYGGTPTMFRCELDASSCVRVKLMTPGTCNFLPTKIAVGDDLVLAGPYSTEFGPEHAPDDWKYILRCTLDGSRCSFEAAFPTAYDAMPDILEDAPDGLYVAGRARDAVIERDLIVRRPHDGASPAVRDATIGPGSTTLTDVMLDAANGKLLTLSSGGGWIRRNGIVSRCELDGSACSAHRVHDATALVGVAGDMLIAGARLAALGGGGEMKWLARCRADGADCTKLADDWSPSLGEPTFAFDPIGARAMIFEPSYNALRVCDAKTGACGDWGQWDWAAYRPRSNFAFDGSRILTDVGTIATCTPTGTCTHGPGLPFTVGGSSRVFLSSNALYVVRSASDRVDGPLELAKCSPDGWVCTSATLVPTRRIRDFSFAIDETRGRLVVATDDDVHGHRPTLVVCDLDGKSCLEGEIGKDVVRSPRVMIHPTNGDVLVVAEANQRPWLYSVTLP